MLMSASAEPTIPAPASSAPLTPSTVLVRPLPSPVTSDPFSLSRLRALAASSPAAELVNVWSTLATSFKTMYGAPDFEEWRELVKIGTGEKEMWSGGVGLLAA